MWPCSTDSHSSELRLALVLFINLSYLVIPLLIFLPLAILSLSAVSIDPCFALDLHSFQVSSRKQKLSMYKLIMGCIVV